MCSKLLQGPVLFSEWTDYSSCSDTCGQGVKIRTRECTQGACDSSDLVDTVACNEGGCKLMLFTHKLYRIDYTLV